MLYENYTIDDINDPCYNEHSSGPAVTTFYIKVKNKYLNSLREFHHTSGTNNCKIAVGDIVLVHDDGLHVQWRLVVVKDLLHGGDGLMSATNIRTSTG